MAPVAELQIFSSGVLLDAGSDSTFFCLRYKTVLLKMLEADKHNGNLTEVLHYDCIYYVLINLIKPLSESLS